MSKRLVFGFAVGLALTMASIGANARDSDKSEIKDEIAAAELLIRAGVSDLQVGDIQGEQEDFTLAEDILQAVVSETRSRA